jgi:hypothetical protein
VISERASISTAPVWLGRRAPDALARRAPDALALALASWHFASFYDAQQPIATDIRYFLYFAWRIAEGDLPYLELFDPKTQLASVVGAALYAAANAFGVEPLAVIRAGELGFCALGGLLFFWVGRRLGGGSSVCGFLALFAYLSFGLIGALPAIGPLPKLLMSILATATALLAQDRRWFAAGLCAGLAVLDWQIGIFAAAGLALAAWGGPGRGRALAQIVLGGASAAAPFAIWLAARGGLGEAWTQLVLSSLSRAAASQADAGFADRLWRIERAVTRTCAEQEWLVALGLLGLATVPLWLHRVRGSDRLRLLIPLSVHQVGIAAFSLLDFQWYGDLFALLQSAIFGLALVWIGAYQGLRRWLPQAAAGRPRVLAAGALAVAALAARPGTLRPPLAIGTPDAPVGVTLADQREVAARVAERLRGRRAVFLGSSELLFLLRWTNPLPAIYWNAAAHSRYRQAPDESSAQTAARTVRSVDPDAIFWRGEPPPGVIPEGYTREWIESSSGRYRVRFFVR